MFSQISYDLPITLNILMCSLALCVYVCVCMCVIVELFKNILQAWQHFAPQNISKPFLRIEHPLM